MPYYPIDTETHHIIIALKDECSALGINNISFEYTDATFHISKYRTHWELVVRSGKYTDIYHIVGGELEFKRTEVD